MVVQFYNATGGSDVIVETNSIDIRFNTLILKDDTGEYHVRYQQQTTGYYWILGELRFTCWRIKPITDLKYPETVKLNNWLKPTE